MPDPISDTSEDRFKRLVSVSVKRADAPAPALVELIFVVLALLAAAYLLVE